MSILTAHYWKNNGEMIADVAKLGYLEGTVLDATYGYGTFWSVYKPDNLIGLDSDPDRVPNNAGVWGDFRWLPFGDRSFDVSVFDPPYKLNGTPTPSVDRRYGVDVARTISERHALALWGLRESVRVARRRVLLKCMDQVSSGKKQWQTRIFADAVEGWGGTLEDMFLKLMKPRQQPGGRAQKHTQANFSTLLVFDVRKAKRD